MKRQTFTILLIATFSVILSHSLGFKPFELTTVFVVIGIAAILAFAYSMCDKDF